MNARATFIEYLRNPDGYWEGAFLRQAEKLKKRLRKIAGEGDQAAWVAIAEEVWDTAEQRAGRYPSVYVTGLGGSGSHWLAEMLHEFEDFVNCGEVYFPPAIIETLDAVDRESSALLVDGLHLVHGWGRKSEVLRARMVNSASGSRKTGDHKRWEPACSVIYLTRDPRDQVLSTTFRKDEYRNWVAPESSDRDYMTQRIRINRADANGYVAGGVEADVVVRYEDLRSEGAASLAAVLSKIGAERPSDEVDAVAVRHSAEAIRSGQVESVGNLDLGGGPSAGWSQMEVETVGPLHAELGATIEMLGYPFGSCLLPPDAGEPVEIPAAPEGLTYFLWRDGAWVESTGTERTADALLARVSQVGAPPEVHVDTLCMSRLDSLSAADLERYLDACRPRQLDVGSVRLDRAGLGLLVERLPDLKAVNMWGVVDERVGRMLATGAGDTLIVF